jgi:hypothetical protein
MAEMITGKRVVAGNALIDIYMMHISDEPFEFDTEVQGCALYSVIQRATMKVIEERYTTAKEMLDDLRGVLPGMSPGASEQVRTAQMGQVSEADVMGGTFELPKETVDQLGSTTEMAGDKKSVPSVAEEPSPQSSTVLMHVSKEQVAKIEAQKPSLDATVDMSRQPKPEWSQRPPSSSGWPASVPAPGSAGAPSVGSQQRVSHHPHSGAPSQMRPSGYPPSSHHSSGLHSSGVHSSGVHNSGLHSAPPIGSGVHDRSGMHPIEDPRSQYYSDYDEEGGGGLAWLLIAVAVIALVAAGVLIWAPWEGTSSIVDGGSLRLVTVARSGVRHA